MSFFLLTVTYILLLAGALLLALAWPRGSTRRWTELNVPELGLGAALVFAAGFILAAALADAPL